MPKSTRRELKLPVPVSILTGHLGVGKTTAITHLLRIKPRDEHWAVLLNEFGSLGIDAAILDASATTSQGGVTVKQLAGGCMCCTLAGPMAAGIAQLVRLAKPDRLLIEPSGLGHPGGLLDVLQGPHLSSSLRLDVVVALIDPTKVAQPEWLESALARAQVTVADVLVINKVDLATPDALAAARRFAADLFPPKLRVVETSRGQVPLALLGLPRDPVFFVGRGAGHALADAASAPVPSALATAAERPLASSARPGEGVRVDASDADVGRRAATLGNVGGGGARGEQATERAGPAGHEAQARIEGLASSDEAAPSGLMLRPRCPLRWPSQDSSHMGHRSCGWMFDANDIFAAQTLQPLMALLWASSLRVKGVMRLGKEYGMVSLGVGGKVELVDIVYRRESRVEIVVGVDETRSQGDGDAHAVTHVLGRLQPSERTLLDKALRDLGGAESVARAVSRGDWDVVEAALVAALR